MKNFYLLTAAAVWLILGGCSSDCETWPLTDSLAESIARAQQRSAYKQYVNDELTDSGDCSFKFIKDGDDERVIFQYYLQKYDRTPQAGTVEAIYSGESIILKGKPYDVNFSDQFVADMKFYKTEQIVEDIEFSIDGWVRDRTVVDTRCEPRWPDYQHEIQLKFKVGDDNYRLEIKTPWRPY